MKPISAQTCVQAWLAACEHLLDQHADEWRDYNVILEIADPLAMTAEDLSVERKVDAFLRAGGTMPISTVVNTIFPAQLYQRHGTAGVYSRYATEVYPSVRAYGDCKWGTYAQRMIQRTDHKGETIYPLADLVEKIKSELSVTGTKRAAYEIGVIDPFLDLPIFDPGHDRNRRISGPCLSHLSFKVSKDRKLHLTALYRNHYYVQKALGNLLGLAHLQYFVVKETGLSVGHLVCHSTSAFLDLNPGKWGKNDVRHLVADCHRATTKLAA